MFVILTFLKGTLLSHGLLVSTSGRRSSTTCGDKQSSIQLLHPHLSSKMDTTGTEKRPFKNPFGHSSSKRVPSHSLLQLWYMAGNLDGESAGNMGEDDDDGDEIIFDALEDGDELRGLVEAEVNLEDLGCFPANFTSSPLSLSELSESFAANVSYFYLQNELNISDAALWGVVFDATSALSMRPGILREKVRVLQETANLTLDEVRLLIERKPTTLHLSAERNLAPTIMFLQRSLDLSKAELRKILVDCPALLSYSLQNLQAKVLFFTQLMQFSLAEVRSLIAQEPKLMRSSVQTGLIPHLKFWCDDLQFSLPDLRRLVLANPKLLLYSIEKSLAPKLIYLLLMKLEMTPQQIQKIVLRNPRFCDYNVDRVLWPTVAYFLNDLDFPTYTVATMLVRSPYLVSHSLERIIKRNVGFLRYELRLSSDAVESIVSRSPTLLGLTLERLKCNVDYVASLLGNDSFDDLQKVLTAMPSLLTVNVEGNLKPKVAFLESLNVDVALVVRKLPALLGYSLARRIHPRAMELQRLGADLDQQLPSILPLTDDAFKKRLSLMKARKEKNKPKPVDASGRITHWTR